MPMPVFVVLGQTSQHQIKGSISIEILNPSCGLWSPIDALGEEKDAPPDTVTESATY